MIFTTLERDGRWIRCAIKAVPIDGFRRSTFSRIGRYRFDSFL
jgi:hypothetical protein